MKAGIVGVALEEFLKVARSTNGISVIQQKGFYKLVGTIPGRAIYPQNNKMVGEVHYSGFAQDPKTKIPGLVANPKYPKPTKRVTHFLDQREGLTQSQILENFGKSLKAMVTEVETEPVQFTKEPVLSPEVIAEMDAALAADAVVTAEK
jgi:hypothetical protein